MDEKAQELARLDPRHIESRTIGELVEEITTLLVKVGMKALAGDRVAVEALAGIYEMSVRTPGQRRTLEFLAELGGRIRALEEKGTLKGTQTALQDSVFQSVLLQAIEAARRTSLRKKLRAFQTASINTLQGKIPSEDQAGIFISLVEAFSESHLSVLSLFRGVQLGRIHVEGVFIQMVMTEDRRKGVIAQSMMSELNQHLQSCITKEMPEGVLDLILSDLTAKQLIQKVDKGAWKVTDLGHAFLEFVEESPGDLNLFGKA